MRRTRAAAWVVVLAAGAAMSGRLAAQDGVTIAVLSSRADMVSGGDALVELRWRGLTESDAPQVTVNGSANVSEKFRYDSTRKSFVGLVDGLAVGRNVVSAAAAGRGQSRLALVNHPITGPIVSGPHLKPFHCRTVESNLGEPLDANCTAATKVEYFYKSTGPAAAPPGGGLALERTSFKPLADVNDRPADLAHTTTRDGKRVPFIVRVESGTINRAIYRIATLHEGWNGRLMVGFGGGCGTNYNQGTNQATAALNDAALARGFAFAISTQNVMQQHCNDHLSGEALMMIKEHFIERYGVPRWTVGIGGSGGAIQQLLIAQNFPGLLDGILPSLTYPDSVSVRAGVTDCRLLINYYKNDPATWTQEKQTAVEGYTPKTCAAWDRAFVDVIVADNARGCGIPAELVYHPVNNPTGARCTMWDTNVATFGRDRSTGFARRSLDNVGVQYGLEALNRGAISKAEFLDLNDRIGGFDNDGHVRAQRTVADPESVRLTYVAGRLNSGAGGLATTPILHYRSYNDPIGDIHDRFRDFTVRERLRKTNGRFDNQVIWVYPTGVAGLAQKVSELAIDTMSDWLDALAQAGTSSPAIDRIKRARPAAATDGCWDGQGTRIDEPASFEGAGRCNALYPNHKNPRLAAGAPLADDIQKCQLKPLDARDYKVSFTPEEMQKLRAIFPDGVCDYSKPGVNQQKLAGTYLRLPLDSSTPTTSRAQHDQH